MIPENKFQDVRKDKPKAFEEIDHNHKESPTRLQSKRCDRCKFDLQEQSMENKKKELGPNTKTDVEQTDGSVIEQTIQLMKVHRGRLDDVIGWSLHWS